MTSPVQSPSPDHCPSRLPHTARAIGPRGSSSSRSCTSSRSSRPRRATGTSSCARSSTGRRVGDGRRGLLVLPARPRRRAADARRDQRPRPEQVGRVSLGLGEGITGRAAADRAPVQSSDVTVDPRFSWVRGFDIARPPRDAVGPARLERRGRRRAQRPDDATSREFTPRGVEFLSTIAALLAGHRREGPAAGRGRGAARPADASSTPPARSCSRSSPTSCGRRSRSSARTSTCSPTPRPRTSDGPRRRRSRTGAPAPTDQVDATGPARRLDPRLRARRGADGPARATRSTSSGAISGPSGRSRSCCGPRAGALGRAAGRAGRPAATSARFRQVLEHLLDNEAKYAPPEQAVSHRRVARRRRDPGLRHRRRPGVPIEDWEAVFQPYVRVDRARSRGSGIGLFAARRLMEAMGGRVWIEPNGYGGSRFVVGVAGCLGLRG